MSDAVRIFDADALLEWDRWYQLASLLPADGDRLPRLVRCKRCGCDLGVVENKYGFAQGTFNHKMEVIKDEATGQSCIEFWHQFAGGSVNRERRAVLKCQCGEVRRFQHQG